MFSLKSCISEIFRSKARVASDNSQNSLAFSLNKVARSLDSLGEEDFKNRVRTNDFTKIPFVSSLNVDFIREVIHWFKTNKPEVLDSYLEESISTQEPEVPSLEIPEVPLPEFEEVFYSDGLDLLSKFDSVRGKAKSLKLTGNFDIRKLLADFHDSESRVVFTIGDGNVLFEAPVLL